jgi:hypothetical protein
MIACVWVWTPGKKQLKQRNSTSRQQQAKSKGVCNILQQQFFYGARPGVQAEFHCRVSLQPLIADDCCQHVTVPPVVGNPGPASANQSMA